jgi:hypothetical protein
MSATATAVECRFLGNNGYRPTARECVLTGAKRLPSARPLIGGAVAAARAIPRDFIGVVAGVASVTIPALRNSTILDSHVAVIPKSYVVIATPEIR